MRGARSKVSRRSRRFSYLLHSQAACEHGGAAIGSLQETVIESGMIQYAAAARLKWLKLWNTGSPGQPSDDSPICGAYRPMGASPETKDPSGGTTGRVKPYGRLGGWALAPNTASMGRAYRSHRYWSREGAARSNHPAIFCVFWQAHWGGTYCGAARLASPMADLPEATAAAGWSKALMAGTSCRPETFSVAGGCGAAATGSAGAVETAVTAA
jgi:hypothetical protein